MPPPFTQRPAGGQKPRNRGLLLAALEAGLAVRPLPDGLYLAESSQLNGSYYLVQTAPATATGAATCRCTCEWGRKTRRPWFQGSNLLPCTHILLVVWFQLPISVQARLAQRDPALGQADRIGQAARRDRQAPRAPAADGRIVAFPAPRPPGARRAA